MSTLEQRRAADLKWLKNAEHWGEWQRFDEVTGGREAIFMLKSKTSPKVRFYAVSKGQVGEDHHHVAAATCWAFANMYLGVSDDPMDIFLQIACREEVLAGGCAEWVHA